MTTATTPGTSLTTEAQIPGTTQDSSEIKNRKSKIENASFPSPDSATFSRLAQLPPAEYDRVRKQEARMLGIRVGTLDDEVSRCRTQIQRDHAFISCLS